MIEVVFEDADGRGNPWIRCSAAELPEALERHPNAGSLADDAIEQMKLPSGGNVRHLELETPNLRSMSGLDSWQELLVLKMNDTRSPCWIESWVWIASEGSL